MSNGKKMLILMIVLVIVLNVVFKPQDDTKDFPDAVWGTPITFVNNTIMPHSDIEQIVADDARVYVLYGSENGVVQVFDLEGTYLYSWRLYTHLNGGFHMAVKGDSLYIQDYHADIYVFRNGEFVEFLSDEKTDTIMAAIPFSKFEENTEGYVVKNGSVWYVSGDVNRCVIERPWITGIYQNNFNVALRVLIIAAAGITYYVYAKLRKKTGDS